MLSDPGVFSVDPCATAAIQPYMLANARYVGVCGQR